MRLREDARMLDDAGHIHSNDPIESRLHAISIQRPNARMHPKVSVVMSVLNGEAFLRAAVDSILGQSFDDLELIVIDNASTDGTAHVLDSYADHRLVRMRNDEVLTLTESLNLGLKTARGGYVARLDADDVAVSERLARQVALLESRPDVVAVASHVRYIDQNGKVIGAYNPPTDPIELYNTFAYENPFQHSSVMFRRNVEI